MPHRSRLFALYGNRTGGGPWTDAQGTLVTSAQSASSANFGLFDEGMVDPGTFTRTGVWTAATSVGVAGLIAIRAAATATPPPSSSTPIAAFLAAQPFHVAHRGGFSIAGGWPEMTMFAYDQAHFRGVLALEVSTWLSASNTWWNLHDRSTAASRGTGVPTWCPTDVDVPTSTDAQIAAVRTTVGNQPLCTLGDLLTKYGQDHIFFIENKRNTNVVAFCDFLQTFPNAIDRFVVKASITALQTAQEWRNRGGQTWGYVYASDVDAGNLTATSAAPFTILGMDYRATQS